MPVLQEEAPSFPPGFSPVVALSFRCFQAGHRRGRGRRLGAGRVSAGSSRVFLRRHARPDSSSAEGPGLGALIPSKFVDHALLQYKETLFFVLHEESAGRMRPRAREARRIPRARTPRCGRSHDRRKLDLLRSRPAWKRAWGPNEVQIAVA